MGWKHGSAEKREIMRSIVNPRTKPPSDWKKYKHIVVDTNAMGRSCGIESKSPLECVRTIFWPSFYEHAKPETITFCFDNYGMESEMRKDFRFRDRERPSDRAPKPGEYKCPISGVIYPWKERPIEDSYVDLIEYDRPLPAPWARIWNNRKGKIRLWDCFAEAIKRVVRDGKRTNAKTEYIIHDCHGKVWTYPEGIPGAEADMDPPSSYGEGDLKAIIWSLYYARFSDRVLLVTIDWDMPLMLAVHAAPIDVKISDVYVSVSEKEPFEFDPDRVKMTAKGAGDVFGSRSIRAAEIIDVMSIMDGVSYDRRLMFLMAAIGFGGVDYNDGLAPFGYTLSVYKTVFSTLSSAPKWLVSVFNKKHPTRRKIRFFPGEYLEFLRRGTPNAPKRGLHELNEEVTRMLYVVTYAALFDSKR
jgi:hypothetical protein